MSVVNTVTGAASVEDLGMTLVHEHLLVGYPGWFMDGRAPPFRRAEAMSRVVDKLEELRGIGVRTLLDPCPVDLGRDVEFMAEAATRSGVRIICTTGAYKQNEGLTYTFGALPVEEIEATYVKELTEGIGETGIRAGAVKVATGSPVTDYERKLLVAAGRAAARVGCCVITHTDRARHGDEQIAALTREGVPAHRILVGHSDGRDDHAYHRSVADLHAYVGFDRFGLESLISDEKRIQSLCAMIEAGYERSVCVSHDSVLCWLGRPVFGGHMVVTPEALSRAQPSWEPSHLFRRILPELRRRGVTDATIRVLLEENPRRWLEGATPPR